MFEEIISTSRQHYERELLKHGNSAKGVNWSDAASQELRFSIICDVADLTNQKIHDVGCGLAHFEEYLSGRGIHCSYVGSDISSLMIEAAMRRSPGLELHCANILDDQEPQWMVADYVVASGVFNVKGNNEKTLWKEFVYKMLYKMIKLSNKGMAFNMLTSYVDYEDPNLFYLAPSEMMDFCIRNLSRRVVIRHDYPLWEYTVYVYK
jgi:SAM-dependent methyltransferase